MFAATTNSSYLVPVYAAYALAAVGLTVWLARTLFRSGAVFLEDVFEKPELAAAVNRLLVTGFYMINLGYAAFLLKASAVDSSTAAIEVLAKKLGILLLSLGRALCERLGVLPLASPQRVAPHATTSRATPHRDSPARPSCAARSDGIRRESDGATIRDDATSDRGIRRALCVMSTMSPLARATTHSPAD